VKFITNFIICLLIASATSAVNVALVFAEEEDKSGNTPEIIVIEGSDITAKPNDLEVIYTEN